MKSLIFKCLLIASVFIFTIDAKCQNTWEDAYEREFEGFCDCFGELGESHAWGSSYALESSLLMYEETGDLIYLSRFVYMARAVMASRADNPLNVTSAGWVAPVANSPIPAEYVGHRGWRRESGNDNTPQPCPFAVDDFQTIKPFAQYIHFIKSNPSLGTLYPMSITFDCSGYSNPKFENRNQELFGQNSTITEFDVSAMTFDEIADYLLARCLETIEDWDEHWDSNHKTYKIDGDCSGNFFPIKTLQLNAEAVIGTTFLYLCEHVDPAKGNEFAEKAAQFIVFWKGASGLYQFGNSGLFYIWNYYSHNDPGTPSAEDLNHAQLDLKFARLFVEMSQTSPVVSNLSLGAQHFNASDLQYFANSYISGFAYDPFEFQMGIYGGDGLCSSWLCGLTGTKKEERKAIMQTSMGSFLPFAANDDDILHRAQDFIMGYALYERMYHDYNSSYLDQDNEFSAAYCNRDEFDNCTSSKTYYETRGLMLLSLANCNKYNRFLYPAATFRRAYEGSNWQATTGGDIDDLPGDEIISIRQHQNTMVLQQVGTDPNTNNLTIEAFGSNSIFSLAPYGSDWAGVACGNFTNAFPGEEIVAISNSNGNIHWFRYDQNSDQIVHMSSYTAPYSGSDWAGIAAGDVNGDGIDEMGLIRNHDNRFFMWGMMWNYMPFTFAYPIYMNNGDDYVAIAAGDFNDDGYDEFAVANNGNNPGFQVVEYNINSQDMSVVASDFSPGFGSNWRCMAGGDFFGTGHDEFLAYRDKDGKFYQYTRDVNNGNIIKTQMIGGEPFPLDDEIRVAGAYNYTGVESCPDHLLVLRNFDAHMFLYSMVEERDLECRFRSNEPEDPGEGRSRGGEIDDEGELKITIYPNPATTEITVMGIDLADADNISIYDLSGREMKCSVLFNNIDVSNLKPGMYIVYIQIGEKKHMNRFIKE